MTIYTRVEFHCDVCRADILYEDELPHILKDQTMIRENNKAERFLRSYPLKYTWAEYRDLLPLIPSHVNYYTNTPGSVGFQAYYLPTKYIICTVCGARIYF